MESMTNAEIVNIVPPFTPSRGIRRWNEFEEMFKTYKQQYHLKFRVQSSQLTEHYNKMHQDQIPFNLRWQHKIFRCTHGNHTHSNPTTKSQAASYVTTETLPLDDQDREDVKTLANAPVSSRHIANFLNERIGCKVTPQQTRNLIRSIRGRDSAEELLKSMLHALRQVDGSDLLAIQDQMNVTTGIVMQTKVQKMMFENWGETLLMGFTHGTNNLSYHLGSLVVTTATGRGFPVVDFISLDQQTATIRTVLEYFKEKNPRWTSIHYWREVMNRSVFRWKVDQRDGLLAVMTRLMYSTTQTSYDSCYNELEQYCKDNKLKMLLGHKTRIDKTIAGLLQRSMQPAITTAKKDQIEPNKLEESVKKQGIVLDTVATIDPKLWKFSGMYVGSTQGFYAIQAKGHMWLEDRKWVEQDWKRIESNVNLFADETGCNELPTEAIPKRHQALANEVISKFASCRLRTKFLTLFGKGMICFDNIIGHICRNWLNDSVVDFCMETIGTFIDTKFINPVNLDSNHWGVIIVRLSYKGDSNNVLSAQVCMYEPLVDEGYHQRDENTVAQGVDDGMRSAHTYNYLTENTEGQNCKISKSDVTVMRLRMLWMIMHHSKELSISKHDAATTAKINQKLQDQLK
ncbi:hypothetical protein PHMEG_00012498 [Phytophthora megakarya]|uniref:ZSWIM1/3 RNaseH-like domain-containing protein n=1 Tax=Phytophthora megakarya TaxID=4795 RepID=A0A225W8L3_9STRA|nr:hypothetical protein PHMEG_00012498 [Phytophthora megakarya]